MQCKKCGANIADTAKFCGYCGSKVEVQPVSMEQPVQNIEQPVEPSVNMVQNENVDLGNTIVVENVNPENTNKEHVNVSNLDSKESKKSNKTLVVLLAIVLGVVAIVLVIMAFNKSNNTSVAVLEKAIANLAEKSENSGTVTAKVTIAEETTGSIVVSATSKYAKVDDKYNFQVTLNQNMFMDETSVYLTFDEEVANLYVQSNIVDMIGMTSSDVNKWLSYSLNLTEEEVSLDGLDELDDVYLKDVLDKEHFVYVDESEDIKHYQLVINEKLIQNIKTKLSKSDNKEAKEMAESIDMEEVDLSEPIYVDFYINNSNELVSISMDLTKLLEEEGITKASIDINFSDLGSTVVTIPDEALNSSVDLMEYFTTNAIDVDTGYDYDYDYSYDTEYDYSY